MLYELTNDPPEDYDSEPCCPRCGEAHVPWCFSDELLYPDDELLYPEHPEFE